MSIDSLRQYVRRFRPPEPTPAVTRLRRLILVTACVAVGVEAMNLALVEEPGYPFAVRTGWTLLRVVGFLFLMREVRFGRAAARPFGLILAVTTAFAVVRLTQPKEGSLVPPGAVVAGFVVLAALCGAVVWQLYRSPAIAAHLHHRPERRPVPGWVLTARVAVVSLAPLMVVPLLVGLGTIDRAAFATARPAVLSLWAGLAIVLTLIVPAVGLFLVFGKAWARWVVGVVSGLILLTQPLLCYLVLGLDGLLRDGVPLAVTATLVLVALHRTRTDDR